MPQKKKPARIYLRERPGRSSVYVIRDGGKEVSLGSVDVSQATAALDRYLFVPANYEVIEHAADVHRAARRMMRGIGERCRTHGRDTDLTVNHLVMLMINQGFKCATSGVRFCTGQTKEGRRSPFAPSPDRIDNSRGYMRDNVRLVSVIVNLARADFSDSDFRAMCEGVVNMARTKGSNRGEVRA